MGWLKQQVGDEWYEFLEPIVTHETFKRNWAQVVQQYNKVPCYPKQEQVFRAFEATPFNDMKVVLVGQDPYHDGVATGLCFDTDGQKFTPSLRKMYEGYSQEYPGNFNTKFMEGKLDHWAPQGILMLNTALTVQKGKANSHSGLWLYFRDRVFEELNKIDRPLLFIAWGVSAHDLVDRKINDPLKKVIKAKHPASAIYSKEPWDPQGSFKGTEYWVFKEYNQKIEW